jgi:hypothetical protein
MCLHEGRGPASLILFLAMSNELNKNSLRRMPLEAEDAVSGPIRTSCETLKSKGSA